ncbi:MAG: hypothetical protein K9H14_07555 [Actinomycetia bacterium]|nr:hypothetical protein [Actinomycetes bacterium]
MKRIIKTCNISLTALGIIALAGYIYNLVFYERLRLPVLAFGDINPILDQMQITAAIFFILIFLFHWAAITYLVINLRFFRRESLFISVLFFLAILSMLMVMGDFALLSDIGKEYQQGWDTSGEWVILYISQALHLVFWVLLAVWMAASVRIRKQQDSQQVIVRDESIFINAQYIGIFCGLSGIAVFVLLSTALPLWALKKGIFSVSMVIILPYLLIALYWLILKLKEKGREWYDEKQYQDICRAGLVTMVSSMVIMFTIYLVQYFTATEFISITWFPFYLFLILLIFSSSTLYFAKRS